MCVLLETAIHHTIEKHFNFVGGFAPQGPPPTALRFAKPTARPHFSFQTKDYAVGWGFTGGAAPRKKSVRTYTHMRVHLPIIEF
jgi:hypothetical protein